MITIRPVSDLRNKFHELESIVQNSKDPVFLTKNGYGTMVLLSIEQYSALVDAAQGKTIPSSSNQTPIVDQDGQPLLVEN